MSHCNNYYSLIDTPTIEYYYLANAAPQQVEADMPKETNMNDRPSSFVSLLSGWVQQGMESFFATQRILVDLAMRQNTSTMKTIRQGITDAKAKESPMNILTEIAVEGSANYIEAQRILLDMAQQENELVLNGVKDRVGDYKTAVAMTNVMRRIIETFIEMQQNFLVLASKKTQGYLQNSEGKDDEANGLVSLAGEAMDEFVKAQRKFIDLVAEETSGEAKDSHPGKKADRKAIAELGREAADCFIDAQKKLLDLAGQQVNVSLQSASRAADIKMPFRVLPMADIAGDSLKSFVDAEKALFNSMSKPRPHVTAEAKARRKPARPAHKATKKAARGKARSARAGAVEV